MTLDKGALSHQILPGANLRASQLGIARATSQKNGEMAATTAKPKT